MPEYIVNIHSSHAESGAEYPPLCPNCDVETELITVVCGMFYHYWCAFCDYEKVIHKPIDTQ